jgi:hypothetical protein
MKKSVDIKPRDLKWDKWDQAYRGPEPEVMQPKSPPPDHRINVRKYPHGKN